MADDQWPGPETPGPENAPDPAPDPKKLRALAHPLRWQLIDLLVSEGTATATRCAEVLGESVASCSYHLGILAKYGYIEEAPGRVGREKPWRLASVEQDLGSRGLDAEGELASEAATEAFLDHEFARTKQRLRHGSLEPEQWQPSLRGETTYLTGEEYAAVSRELHDVLNRYRRDILDPSRRPEGSRQVRLFIAASAAPLSPEAPSREAPSPAPRPAPMDD
ncbi:MAG: winged helix-turn-helix transcriptional regulator [Nocardiopsaceae bacterium]|nr:winged helix-turn-helix transcriptional regulator [Nocardiopsaceae bacterium]